MISTEQYPENYGDFYILIVALARACDGGRSGSCFAAGTGGFVTKPVRSSDLLGEIPRLAIGAGGLGSSRARIRSAGGTA
jgi:hypothetical protein